MADIQDITLCWEGIVPFMLDRASRSARSRRCAGEDGFSMIEVLVSMVLLLIVAGAGASILIAGMTSTRNSSYRVKASGIANELIEQYRNAAALSCAWTSPLANTCAATTSVGGPTAGVVTTPSDVPDGSFFTATQTTSWQDKSSTASCSSNGQGGTSANLQPVLAVTESVTWPKMTVQPVTSHTVLTPPPTVYGTTGSILGTVLNAANTGVSGAAVTITPTAGGTANSYTTDSNGCFFAVHVAAGSYTVTVTKTNYITPLETPTSTVTNLAVVAGQVTSKQFVYDYQDALTPAFTPVTGQYAHESTSIFPVTVANSGMTTATQTYQLPNGVKAASDVFPFTSAYSIYPGHCPAANPVVSGATPATVSTTPGGTTSATVPLYRLTVGVKDSAAKSVDISLTELSGTGALACSGLASYDLTPSPYNVTTSKTAYTNYVFGVPLGSYTLKVIGTTTKTSTLNMASGGSTVQVSS